MQNGSHEVGKCGSFMDKMDEAARTVSKGFGCPNVLLAYHWGKAVLQNILFGIIVYYFPTDDLDPRECLWRTLVRYTAWVHLLESVGFRHGPMFGRTAPGPLGQFATVYYRLTPGTLKFSLVHGDCFPLNFFQGRFVKRNVFDAILHFCIFIALGAVAVVPDSPYAVLVAAAVGTNWLFLYDHQAWTSAHGSTYTYILAAGCFPASSGALACAQLHTMNVWIGSGLGKVGPWFQFVNGPFMTNSIFLRGREWFWHFAVNGKDNLRPTWIMGWISSLAAHVEWGAPLLLLTGVPPVIYFGVFALVAIHAYINFAPAVMDVYNWNYWFMAAAVIMFGGSPALSLGVDYAGLAIAPRWLLFWLSLEFAYIWYGLMSPENSPYQASHRNWAGNWPNGVVLVRKAAADKLLEGWTIPGKPHWSPPPAWYLALLARLGQKPVDYEMRAYLSLGNFWNTCMNMKFLPALVQQVLHGQPIGDFYVMDVRHFADLFIGGVSWTHRIPELCIAVGEQTQIEAGDCVCIWMGAFPFRFGRFQGSHPWKIVDVKKGVLDEGEISLAKSWAIAGLPSDGERGEAMLS